MEWGAAIAAILGILLAALKAYLANAPKRSQEAADDATQTGREQIATGDDVAFNDRIDRLLPATGNPAGATGREVTAERIRTVAGLADPGRNPGADTGTGRSLPEGK